MLQKYKLNSWFETLKKKSMIWGPIQINEIDGSMTVRPIRSALYFTRYWIMINSCVTVVEKTRIGSGIKRHLAGQIPNSSRGKKKLRKKFKIGTRREKKTMKGQAPKGSVKKFRMWVSSFFYPRSFWPMNSRWKFICKITTNRPTSQNLVPIRVDFEVEGQRFKDSFTWNPSGKSWILYVFFFIFVFFFFSNLGSCAAEKF